MGQSHTLGRSSGCWKLLLGSLGRGSDPRAAQWPLYSQHDYFEKHHALFPITAKSNSILWKCHNFYEGIIDIYIVLVVGIQHDDLVYCIL